MKFNVPVQNMKNDHIVNDIVEHNVSIFQICEDLDNALNDFAMNDGLPETAWNTMR